MEGNGFREWSFIARLRYFQEEKKREAVGTVGPFHLNLNC